MSEGLKALLEAAQFIEQQEKLKLSPLTTQIPAMLNEQQQRFIMHAYDATVAAAVAAAASSNVTNTTTSGHLNGGSINIRNSSVRHGNTSSLQVSSSAPASSATFQHLDDRNNDNSCISNTTTFTLHPAPHAATKVLTNGTKNASTSSTTASGPQQLLHQSLHRHPHLNLSHEQNCQLINVNNPDYEFNGNDKPSGNVASAVTPTSSSGRTSGNLLQPSLKSTEGRLTDDANSGNTSSASFMLLTNSTTTKLFKTSPSPVPMITDEEQEHIIIKSNSTAEKTEGGGATTFTLIGRNGETLGNATNSKQMLLTNGLRIATPTVSIGPVQQEPLQVTASKAIIAGLSNQLTSSGTPLLSHYQQFSHNGRNGGVGGSSTSSSNSVVLTNRNKTFIPLTPPPMSSRKFVEPTQSRIRSFSLSSHKISANNHHQLNVQNGNNSSTMLVDDIPPTQQHHHSSSSQHSPPCHASSSLGAAAGSHYMHMINTASSQQAGLAGSGVNHVAHTRRRTISSTSNGAGTREVHNKLEKNRRAHLKECYEALKNQLSLKDEDRRKTSNLAILGEALKCVQSFQKRNQELEAEWEHLANEKINLQKRFVSLKRELGQKYEQIFSGIFPDTETGSNLSEREAINENHSLSSGRGSTLYSSSSSLSSGGSNGSSSSNGTSGSNTISSPVGAGIHTSIPTSISPVINKMNSTSPISINSNSKVVIQQQHQRKNPSITTTIQAVAISTQSSVGGGDVSSPPAGSPTALVPFGSSLPLSLTAKNISATAVTRGSPTPSTPSPSPSSSSGVSSSSSLISSSPPINGVISNGRNMTVNIPNGLKLQAAAVAEVCPNGSGNGVISGSGTTTSTTATLLATSAPPQGVKNTNNVLGNQQQNDRKKNLILSNSNNNNNNNKNVVDSKSNYVQQHQQQQKQHHSNEDGEQPAKFFKVFNSSNTAINSHYQHEVQTHGQKFLLTSNGGVFQGGNCGGNTISASIVSSSVTATVTAINKSMANGSVSYAATPATIVTTNELCRLPGGAELNILPSNGLKMSTGGAVPVATAFYHTNGKITFVNGPTAHQHSHAQQYPYQHPPSSPLPNSTTITNNATTLTNGILLKDATSVTPLLVSAASSPTTSSVNGLHFSGNFSQLLAAANTTVAASNTTDHSFNEISNATASIVPMAANSQNIVESETKNNKVRGDSSWDPSCPSRHS